MTETNMSDNAEEEFIDEDLLPEPPMPEWKTHDWARDVLPAQD